MKKYRVEFRTGRGYSVTVAGVMAHSASEAVARARYQASLMAGGEVFKGKASLQREMV